MVAVETSIPDAVESADSNDSNATGGGSARSNVTILTPSSSVDGSVAGENDVATTQTEKSTKGLMAELWVAESSALPSAHKNNLEMCVEGNTEVACMKGLLSRLEREQSIAQTELDNVTKEMESASVFDRCLMGSGAFGDEQTDILTSKRTEARGRLYDLTMTIYSLRKAISKKETPTITKEEGSLFSWRWTDDEKASAQKRMTNNRSALLSAINPLTYIYPAWTKYTGMATTGLTLAAAGVGAWMACSAFGNLGTGVAGFASALDTWNRWSERSDWSDHGTSQNRGPLTAHLGPGDTPIGYFIPSSNGYRI